MTLQELIKANPDGFTFDPETKKLAEHKTGFYVSLTNNMTFECDKFVKAFYAFNLACPRKVYIGYWSQGGAQYLDYAVHVETLALATLLSSVFSQLAIWDCKNNKEIAMSS